MSFSIHLVHKLKLEEPARATCAIFFPELFIHLDDVLSNKTALTEYIVSIWRPITTRNFELLGIIQPSFVLGCSRKLVVLCKMTLDGYVVL